MINFFTKISWIIFIGFGLYIAYAIFTVINKPDYKSELIEAFPVQLKVKFNDIDEYLNESSDTARKYIFSPFDFYDNYNIQDLLDKLGINEVVEYKDKDIYFTYKFINPYYYNEFLQRVELLQSIPPSDSKEALSLAYYYLYYNLSHLREPLDFVQDVEISSDSISFKINSFFLKIPKYERYSQFNEIIKQKYLIGFNSKKKMLGWGDDDLGSLRKMYDSANYMEIYTNKENADNIKNEFTSIYYDISIMPSNVLFNAMSENNAKFYYDYFLKGN